MLPADSVNTDEPEALAEVSSFIKREGIRPNYKVRMLREQLQAARDIMDDAYVRCQVKDASGMLLASAADFDNWKKASDVWGKTLDSLWAAVREQKADDARRRAERNVLRKQEIVQDLMAEYGNFGPQYRELVDLVAGLTVKMEAHLEAGGGEADYMAMLKAKLDLIGQLQKYTEASRTQNTVVTAQLNEFGQAFMGVVYEILQDQPSKVLEITKRFETLLLEGPKG